MKRKILSIALIAALVFALSVSVFAAGGESPGDSDALPTVTEGTIAPADAGTAGAAAGCVDSTTGWSRVASVLGTTAKKVQYGSMTVQAVFDFTPADPTQVAAGQQVTFSNVPGVKQGQRVVAWHKKNAEGTADSWEVLPARATADGTVVVTFNGSASPIAIITVTLQSDGAANPGTPSTVVTSPQTSDIG